MDSQLAQVISGSAYLQQGDSVLQGGESSAERQPQQESAAEMVFESNQENVVPFAGAQQHSSMSEGVASVGAETQQPLEETGEVFAGMGDTSDLGGSNQPLDPAASVQQQQHQQPAISGHGKRKSRGSEMGEVADTDDVSKFGDESQGGPSSMCRAPAVDPFDVCDSSALPPLASGDEGVLSLADQPTDAEILAWQNQIMEAEGKDQPLVGDREPLAVLEAEYIAGSPVFVQKIEKLKGCYGSIRRSRGDGNCFYRSFFFGYLEHLIITHDKAERDRVLRRLDGLKQTLLNSGYEELVFEGPLDMMIQMLRSVSSPVEPLTIDSLESNMRTGDIGNYMLFMLRMLTTCEIKGRADFFAPFILGMSDMDVDTFCSRCVDPMGEESDHVQLVALTDALQVPIRVVYLDRSLGGPGNSGEEGGVHVDMHDFVPEDVAAAGAVAAAPRVHLLYRPGHYDILYPL